MIWDNYGLYAQGSFDSLPAGGQTVNYLFRIYRKNYKGAAFSVTCGKDAIIHRYLSDDPIAPVKGSEINLNILNTGTTPLSLFYSEEDDTYKIEVDGTFLEFDGIGPVTVTKRIFNGFLVQEDCEEVLTDFTHELKLVFTDNLGILKDVSFDFANKVSPPLATSLRQDIMAVGINQENYTVNLGEYLYVSKTTGSPQVGDFVTVQRAGAANGTYEIQKITTPPAQPGYRLFIKERPPGVALSATSALVTYITASDINWRIKLSDCLRICLHATGIPLSIFYQGNLTAMNGATVYSRFLENIYIDGRTFLSDSQWDSCYTVLDKICTRFGLSIFQADGNWHIVRWNELRYYNNDITVYKYDQYMTYFGSQTGYSKIFNLGHGEVEEGVSETLIRPYQFYSETFNFNQISNIAKNINLDNYGPFKSRTQFTTDSKDYYRYDYENDGFSLLNSNYSASISRIDLKDNNETKDKFLRIERKSGGDGPNYKVARTSPIEVKKGDQCTIKISVRAWNLPTDSAYLFIQVESGATDAEKYFLSRAKNDDDFNKWVVLTDLDFGDLTGQKYPPKWSILFGTYTSYPENVEVIKPYKEFELNTDYFPTDGVLYIYFGCCSASGTSYRITDYTNMSIEIKSKNPGESDRKGQLHKGYKSNSIKNSKNQEIYADINTKNFNKGTLFLNDFQNLIQVRSAEWRDGITTTNYNLGNITTKQIEYWRDKVRSKIELNFFPIIKSNYQRSVMYNIINFAPKTGRHYIFGKAEFNLRENTVKASLYEMWKDGEAGTQGIDTDPEIKYEFKYLYK